MFVPIIFTIHDIVTLIFLNIKHLNWWEICDQVMLLSLYYQIKDKRDYVDLFKNLFCKFFLLERKLKYYLNKILFIYICLHLWILALAKNKFWVFMKALARVEILSHPSGIFQTVGTTFIMKVWCLQIYILAICTK